MQATDDSPSNVKTIPPGVLGVFLVALVAGLACLLLFMPKQHPADNATTTATVPATQTTTSAEKPSPPQKSTKKRRRKHS